MVYVAEEFIQRFGTHYIKAARFGGQLEIRKSMEASEVASKEEFSEVMEFEFKTFFASPALEAVTKKGSVPDPRQKRLLLQCQCKVEIRK